MRALCAIARAVLVDDRTIDDAEWRERIKCRLIAQGWDYPTRREMLGDAMTRVERALEREWGSRPALTG
jgi:hypothetical protein